MVGAEEGPHRQHALLSPLEDPYVLLPSPETDQYPGGTPFSTQQVAWGAPGLCMKQHGKERLLGASVGRAGCLGPAV